MRVRHYVLLFAVLFAFSDARSWSPSDTPDAPVRQPTPGCGALGSRPGALGPLDYRTTPQRTIDFVEIRHFTRAVETLKHGERSGDVPSDIEFMLGVFPNHPRALRSAAAVIRRNGGKVPNGLVYGIHCWFDRAIAFRPDDADVRIVYAYELLRDRKEAEAREQALESEPFASSARVQYNLGLVFFELKDFERSLLYAKKAYEAGFDLPGLRNKLQQAGQWRE